MNLFLNFRWSIRESRITLLSVSNRYIFLGGYELKRSKIFSSGTFLWRPKFAVLFFRVCWFETRKGHYLKFSFFSEIFLRKFGSILLFLGTDVRNLFSCKFFVIGIQPAKPGDPISEFILRYVYSTWWILICFYNI